MKKYLGVKVIHAEPMSQYDFISKVKNEDIPQGVKNIAGYKVVYEGGYTSWSPKEVFEKAYRPVDNLTFGLAIEALKQGKKVARKGWNGRNMWLKLLNPNKGINTFHECSDWWREDYSPEEDQIETMLPTICMKTADNKMLTGWLASQTDMLSEDWEIIE